jgi:hypothetical protein
MSSEHLSHNGKNKIVHLVDLKFDIGNYFTRSYVQTT